MQTDLDAWLVTYNTKRFHQGLGMERRTSDQAFQDGRDWEEQIAEQVPHEAA